MCIAVLRRPSRACATEQRLHTAVTEVTLLLSVWDDGCTARTWQLRLAPGDAVDESTHRAFQAKTRLSLMQPGTNSALAAHALATQSTHCTHTPLCTSTGLVSLVPPAPPHGRAPPM